MGAVMGCLCRWRRHNKWKWFNTPKTMPIHRELTILEEKVENFDLSDDYDSNSEKVWQTIIPAGYAAVDAADPPAANNKIVPSSDGPPSGGGAVKVYRIGIVGGGASATSFSIQLYPKLRQLQRQHQLRYPGGVVELLVFERGERVGPGLAYTIHPDGDTFRLNRTKDSMDPYAGRIGQFTAWLAEHGDEEARAGDFPLRSAYGKYLVYLLEELKRVSERVGSPLRVEYLTRTVVSEITVSDGGGENEGAATKYVIHAQGEGEKAPREWEVDTVVLCTGHYPVPSYPEFIGLPNYARDYPGYRRLINQVVAECGDDENAVVGVIGSAYTAVDIAIELEERGYRGKVVMGCRMGILPTTCEPPSIKVFQKSNEEEEESFGGSITSERLGANQTKRSLQQLTDQAASHLVLEKKNNHSSLQTLPNGSRRGSGLGAGNRLRSLFSKRRPSSILSEEYTNKLCMANSDEFRKFGSGGEGVRRSSVAVRSIEQLDMEGAGDRGGEIGVGLGNSNSNLFNRARNWLNKAVTTRDLERMPSVKVKYISGFTLSSMSSTQRRSSLHRSLICTNQILTTTSTSMDRAEGGGGVEGGDNKDEWEAKSVGGGEAAEPTAPADTEGGGGAIVRKRATTISSTTVQPTMITYGPAPRRMRRLSVSTSTLQPQLKLRHYHLSHLNPESLPRPLRADDIVERLFREISDLQRGDEGGAKGEGGEGGANGQVTFADLEALHREHSPLKIISRQIATAERGAVQPWQMVLFALGPLFLELWNALDDVERKRYLDRYHVYFLRYASYIALENARRLKGMLEQRRLSLLRAMEPVKVVQQQGEGGEEGVDAKVEPCYEMKGFEGDTPKTYRVKALFNASGMTGSPKDIQPLANMLRSGLVIPHPYGGLRINRDTHQTLDAESRVNEGIYAIGEPAKGYFFISADMPTVAEQAEKVACEVAQKLHALQK